jgi:mRNA interferase MazF
LTGPIGVVPEILVVYISSVVPAQLLPSDVVIDPSIPEFLGSGLKVISVLRLHKMATIHVTSLARKLGNLHPSRYSVIAGKLQVLLSID